MTDIVSHKHAVATLVLLLIIASGYWVWVGLTQRSIIEDDGISLIAAQGVLEYGYPRLPSGYLYHRAYLPTYLLAGSIGLWGLNDFSIMLPSLLMALGCFLIVYLLASDILENPWVGVAAIALLAMAQIQTFYATGPRMYMTLQFFTLLALYSAYRGYLGDEKKFQYIAMLSVAAAILSHQEGGILVAALPLSMGVVRWLAGQGVAPLLSLRNVLMYAGVMLIFLFMFVYAPPDKPQRIVAHGGQPIEFVGLNLNPGSWLNSFNQFENIMPFTLILLIIALLWVLRDLRESRYGPAYAIFVFFFCALGTVLALNMIQDRFWFFILPLYALLVCFGGAGILRLGFQIIRRNFIIGSVALLSLGVGGALALIYGSPDARFVNAVKIAYGVPCQGYECHRNIKTEYALIQPQIRPEDMIVSSNPWVTHYYLGRVDGFLREKIIEGGLFGTFQSKTDEYFGISLIDSFDELRELLSGKKRVWVVVDYKAQIFSSPQTREYLHQMFDNYHAGKFLSVYLHCEAPPCVRANE